jgi:hypothetical protein
MRPTFAPSRQALRLLPALLAAGAVLASLRGIGAEPLRGGDGPRWTGTITVRSVVDYEDSVEGDEVSESVRERWNCVADLSVRRNGSVHGDVSDNYLFRSIRIDRNDYWWYREDLIEREGSEQGEVRGDVRVVFHHGSNEYFVSGYEAPNISVHRTSTRTLKNKEGEEVVDEKESVTNANCSLPITPHARGRFAGDVEPEHVSGRLERPIYDSDGFRKGTTSVEWDLWRRIDNGDCERAPAASDDLFAWSMVERLRIRDGQTLGASPV